MTQIRATRANYGEAQKIANAILMETAALAFLTDDSKTKLAKAFIELQIEYSKVRNEAKLKAEECGGEITKSLLVYEEWVPVYSADGKAIREWRSCHNIGLRELARRLKVSSAYLSRIETSADKNFRIGREFAERLIALEDN